MGCCEAGRRVGGMETGARQAGLGGSGTQSTLGTRSDSGGGESFNTLLEARREC